MVILPKKVVEQALEALYQLLEWDYHGHPLDANSADGVAAIDSLRKALEAKPVAWGNFQQDGTLVGLSQHPEDQVNWAGRRPLYTPPQAEPEVCKPSTMKKGGRYNWKGHPERLIYIGLDRNGYGFWHQFEKVGAPGIVWCEVRGAELGMLEETVPQPEQWVDLTDEEMDGALRRAGVVATFAALRCVGREVEAKLREKNRGTIEA